MSTTTRFPNSRPVSTGCDTLSCPPLIESTNARQYTHIIHHGGRHFAATATMADIFMAHAGDIIDRDESALVPLLHKLGVDMLLVTPHSKITVSQIDIVSRKAEREPASVSSGFATDLAS